MPAIKTAQNASEEEEFMGFNDCNKDTVHEMVSMFEKLDYQTLNVIKSGRRGRADQCR